MKSTGFILMFIFFFGSINDSFAEAKNDKGQTGYDIVKKATDFVGMGSNLSDDNSNTPRSFKSKQIMKIYYSGGRVVKKEFESIFKKNFDGKGTDGMLLRFIRPSKIKVLGHVRKRKPNDQWIKLSSGKPKRIAEIGREKSFVGSHFCYGDIKGRKLEDGKYKYLGEKKVLGSDCYSVEAIETEESIKRSGEDTLYEKTIIFLRKSDCFPVRMEMYKNGELFKYLELYNIKKIKGYTTPLKVIMFRADGKGKTEIITEKGYPKYDVRVKSRDLRAQSL